MDPEWINANEVPFWTFKKSNTQLGSEAEKKATQKGGDHKLEVREGVTARTCKPGLKSGVPRSSKRGGGGGKKNKHL